jgi:drug/metabolite transporter (DMT)-like permease
MLQIAISAGLMFGIFKIFESKNKKYDLAEIDVWVGAAVVAAPAFILFCIKIAFDNPQGLVFLLISLLTYFLVPFLYFKTLLEYPTKMAALYSAFVPIVVTAVEIVLIGLMK